MIPDSKRGRDAYSHSLLHIEDKHDARCLHEVVIGNKTWGHYYEPERKAQSMDAKRKKPTSNRKEKSISEEYAAPDILQLKYCVK